MNVLYNLAIMTVSGTPGTGTITLGSPATVNGTLYLSFSAAGVQDGDLVTYAIADTNNSEIGIGTYTAAGTTLARTTVINSTNSGSAISATSAAIVFITGSARDMLAATQLGPGLTLINGTITQSVASSALTIAIKTRAGADPTTQLPVFAVFRNATAATGDYTILALTAATSITVSSGSTLGTSNSTAFRIWVVGFNDAATFRLGVINCLSGINIYPLQGWAIASSTAEGGAGAADSAQVFYTGTAVTSKPYAILGYVAYESGLATAGTWSATGTRLQLFDPSTVPLPGARIQTQRNITGANATGTTQIPYDDTIPQNTEGDQFLSQAITPTSATNVLEIDVQAIINTSVSNRTTGALFQDSTANALSSVICNIDASTDYRVLNIHHCMLSATSSSTTFKFRAGANTAGTWAINGEGASRKDGGVLNSYMEVREIMA